MRNEQLTLAITEHLAQLTASLNAIASGPGWGRRGRKLERELKSIHQKVVREERLLVSKFDLPAVTVGGLDDDSPGDRPSSLAGHLRNGQELSRSLEDYFRFFGMPAVARFYHQLRYDLYGCERLIGELGEPVAEPPPSERLTQTAAPGQSISPVAAALQHCPVYFMVDESICLSRDPLAVGRAALSAGVRVMQLRFKALPAHALLTLARQLKPACTKHDCLLIVNDRADIALLAGADGVHGGVHDLQPADIRALAPALTVGATARNPEDALAAQRAGADYVGAGSVYGSETKPGLPVIGVDGIAQIAAPLSVPVVAIGGITADNCAEVLAAGASGFACVKPFVTEAPIEDVVAQLRQSCQRAATG